MRLWGKHELRGSSLYKEGGQHAPEYPSVPKQYWYDLKKKLTKEGSQLYEEIVQLKFEAVVSL